MLKHLFDVLKNFYYEELFDIPKSYVKIENELACHVFTIAFVILMISLVWIVIINIKEVIQLKKDNRILRRKIEKHLYGVLKNKNK